MKLSSKKLIPPVVLGGLAIVLAWKNYQPHTWLSGWDTLHPEFNFLLYFKRAFFSLWQEHQGLGAVASQAHASEMPRLLIASLSSLFLPDNLIRYSYFFLTLILGPLGVYYFLKYLTKNNLASFVGGLFFLLNLTTLQHYYLPLEMFATLFASIGWLFLYSLKFLKEGKKRSLIILSFIFIFSAPMGHTPTLFFAFLLGLFSYLFTVTILAHLPLKKFAIIGLTGILVNSFWLLPSLYFIFNQGSWVSQSKIHQQFSPYAFSYSHKFGNLNNTIQLKNFLFDWGEFNDLAGQFTPVFDEWIPHLNNPIIKPIAYLIFSLVVLGLALAIIKKNRDIIAMALPFLISFLFIANDFVVFETIFSFLAKKIPLFQEALRFPFTKFSTIMAFSWAIFIGYAITLFTKKHWQILASSIVSLLLLIQMWPALGGNLISPSMKVNFPPEYFETMHWLNKPENQGRIAHFPIHTFRGWSYYRWQYEGAGFWWFGLESPFLDREFDRWSPRSNENYFWEISNAIYSKNIELTESVLDKYQIRWILVDKNIFDPSSNRAPSFETIDSLFNSSDKISFKKRFNDINIYQYSLSQGPEAISILNDLKNIGPQYQWTEKDIAYLENNSYLTDETSDWDIYYPYRALFTKKSQNDLEFSIEESGNLFTIKSSLGFNQKNNFLIIPENYSQSYYDAPESNLANINYYSPEIAIDNKTISAFIPKTEGSLSRFISPKKERIIAQNCHPDQDGQVAIKIINDGEPFWQLSATNAYNCGAIFWLPTLPQNIPYLIRVRHQHQEGNSALFWLENLQYRKADIETYLPKTKDTPITSYFIQPPADPEGIGYGLHFDNVSVSDKPTTNLLGAIEIYPFPLDFLNHLKIVFSENDQNFPSAGPTIKKIQHPNPSIFQVTLEPSASNQSSTIWLKQTYHQGWQAYPIKNTDTNFKKYFIGLFPFLFGQPLEHQLINNWSNGWQLENNISKVIIYFVPQLLQYLGFFLTTAYLLVLFLIKKFPRRNTPLVPKSRKYF